MSAKYACSVSEPCDWCLNNRPEFADRGGAIRRGGDGAMIRILLKMAWNRVQAAWVARKIRSTRRRADRAWSNAQQAQHHSDPR